MAKDSDPLAGALDADTTGGLLSGLLAEENEFDRRTLWRTGSWGFAAFAAVFIAAMANQSSFGWRREQVAATDLARQAQQIRELTRESQNETRRFAAAIDTLNNDRDRLYSRVTILEQGLDSVTGTIAKQSSTAVPAPSAGPAPSPAPEASPPPQSPPALPALAPVAAAPPTATVDRPRSDPAKPAPNVATAMPVPAPAPAPAATPATLVAPKSMMGPPDPAAPKLIEVVKPSAESAAPATPDSAAPQPGREAQGAEADTPKVAVQRTEFAVDLGGANSVAGLRALWRGLLKSNVGLAELHPIIVVKESNTGLGMQLRLAAGPLQDAAAAAKICAALLESERGCETTVFDGQRLAMAADETQPVAGAKPPPTIKAVPYRRNAPKRVQKDDPPPKQESSTLSSWFGGSKR